MSWSTHWLHEDQNEVKRWIRAWRVMAAAGSVHYDPWLGAFILEPGV
jgi:hypothetical protein